MKIGIDGRMMHWPGIGRFVRELVEQLLAIDDRNQYCLYAAPGCGIPFDAPNLRVIQMGTPIHSIREQVALPRIIARDRLQLWYAPTTLVIPWFCPCKMIVTLHDLTYCRFPRYLRSSAARCYFNACNGRALRAAARIVAISETTKQDAENRFPKCASKLERIYNGLSPSWKVIDNTAEVESFNSDLGLLSKYILYVGTLKEHKNVVSLVNAYALLPQETRNEYSLVLLAQLDSRYPEVPALIRYLGLDRHTHILDHLSDESMPLLYSGASLFVMPSRSEGFCFPIVEAMACGVPVACSNVSVMPETAGGAAILFDPLSVSDIKRQMERALYDEELRKDLRQRGLERAQVFSWKTTAEQYLRCFEQVGGKDCS